MLGQKNFVLAAALSGRSSADGRIASWANQSAPEPAYFPTNQKNSNQSLGKYEKLILKKTHTNN